MARERQAPRPPDEQPRTTTEIAIRPCSLIPSIDTPLTQCPTNLDLTTHRGKALAVQAGSPGDIIFGPDGKARIKAVAYLLMPEEVVSVETGEATVVARTVLYGADGRHWRTTSESAPHALHRILQLWSADEWAAGIEIEISERMSPKTKRVYHDMRVIYDHPATTAG